MVVALIVLSGLLTSVLLYRAATNEGELVLVGKGVEGEVEITQRGKKIARLDTRRQRSINLPPGEYEADLVGGDNDVKLLRDGFTIERGKPTTLRLAPVIQTIKDGLVICPRGRGQCKTLGEAVGRATEGMRLLLRTGVNKEPLTVPKRVVIEGEAKADTRIDCTTGTCLTLQADGIQVRNLTLNCRAGRESKKPAVDIPLGKKIVLEECDLTSTDVALLVRGVGTDVTVRRCALHNAGVNGMRVEAGARCHARSSRFFENQGFGVVVWDGQVDVEECDVFLNLFSGIAVGAKSLVRVTGRCRIYSNTDSGILVDTEQSEVIVKDCTIKENSRSGLAVRTGAKATVEDSQINRNREWGVYAETSASARVEKCDLTENKRGARHEETEGKIAGSNNKE